ncbi:hypothetical protein MAXJ12_19473 [Mesorhizobium alhagi CCNWXJ12-2]|uniref:Uncharacterized protein n=1 Tax=Mesorhizobium alhagi CCNWXJ12-2 TaxID=1107882 RepID=H0HUN5_9HYPH|nr:hypothetical protein MAXJ12_19473 [Mesorhizobium alhagi CCNWXJ12-2]
MQLSLVDKGRVLLGTVLVPTPLSKEKLLAGDSPAAFVDPAGDEDVEAG